MSKDLITKLRSGASLDRVEIERSCSWLVEETASVEDRADFLHALHAKGETAEEIACFADTFIRLATPFPLARERFSPLVDVCGTGGDGKNFFNVSTCVMFVVAACGAKVVKHGNRSVTSQCGGADVLEALGVNIHLSPEQAVRCLEKSGAVFLFAPDYYPSFKAIAPVRKFLAGRGERSIFNILGPLLNPARPEYQLTGVFSPALLEIYANALIQTGRKKVWVVCGAGGEDELSVSGDSQVIEATSSGATRFTVLPPGERIAESLLVGGDARSNASILEGILDGKITDGRRDIVLLNAAAALVVANSVSDLPSGMDKAKNAIVAGDARDVLSRMREF